jgi:diaminohydroxyphosphoribosylaminopyrimidine deaminase / 5-amino-6-(5-phosphoribosylamino)uracil reductase
VAPGRVATNAEAESHMRRALRLADRGLGLASPNPRVGAVVVSGGRVVGEGWHEGPGTPHAEAAAVAAAGDRAQGATLFVTLEPCSHHGRTPPCADALIRAQVARVIMGVRDPNPLVDGRGLDRLAAAGVEVVEGVLGEQCARVIEGFQRHVRTGRPFVTLKAAASLDGKVAAADGSSRWITGRESRRDAHLLRAAADAVLVGSGTVAADDPSLTVRLEEFRGRQPLRVVVDGSGRTPAHAAVFDGRAPALVAATQSVLPAVRRRWEGTGAEVQVVDELDEEGRPSLRRLMELLGKRDVQSVLIEGGPTLSWSAVRQGLVDRLVLYLAPKLIGGRAAPSVLGGGGVATVGDALPLGIVSVERLGDGIKVVAEGEGKTDVHRDH